MIKNIDDELIGMYKLYLGMKFELQRFYKYRCRVLTDSKERIIWNEATDTLENIIERLESGSVSDVKILEEIPIM